MWNKGDRAAVLEIHLKTEQVYLALVAPGKLNAVLSAFRLGKEMVDLEISGGDGRRLLVDPSWIAYVVTDVMEFG
jgi:hypothetical protein